MLHCIPAASIEDGCIQSKLHVMPKLFKQKQAKQQQRCEAFTQASLHSCRMLRELSINTLFSAASLSTSCLDSASLLSDARLASRLLCTNKNTACCHGLEKLWCFTLFQLIFCCELPCLRGCLLIPVHKSEHNLVSKTRESVELHVFSAHLFAMSWLVLQV